MSWGRRTYGRISPAHMARAYFGLESYEDPKDAHITGPHSYMGAWLLEHCRPRPGRHRVGLAGPRDSGKSTDGAVIVPSYRALFTTNRLGLMVGASMDLAKKNLFGLKQEFEGKNQLLAQDFGDLRDSRKWAEEEIRIFKPEDMALPIDQRRHCTIRCVTHKTAIKSMKLGPVRPDFAIGDDAQREEETENRHSREVFERWFWGKFLMTMAKEHFVLWVFNMEEEQSIGSQLLAGCPFTDDEGGEYGRRDDELAARYESWDRLKVQAIIEEGTARERSYHPERYSLEELRTIRKETPLGVWMAQMQQDPRDPAAAVFTEKDVGLELAYGRAPVGIEDARQRWPGMVSFAGIDRATSLQPTADYTAMVTLGREAKGLRFRWLAAMNERLSLEAMHGRIITGHQLWGWMVLFIEVEGQQRDFYEAVVLRLRQAKCGLQVIPIRHSIRGKHERISGVQPWYRDGTITLAEDHAQAREAHLDYRPGRGFDDLLDCGAMVLVEAMKLGTGASAEPPAKPKDSALRGLAARDKLRRQRLRGKTLLKF